MFAFSSDYANLKWSQEWNRPKVSVKAALTQLNKGLLTAQDRLVGSISAFGAIRAPAPVRWPSYFLPLRLVYPSCCQLQL